MVKSLTILNLSGEFLYPKTVSELVFDNNTGNTVADDLANKQDKLIDGTSIKTINGSSLLGRGNILVNEAFKGWYASSTALSNEISSPSVGNYAYVKGATSSDPVTIYECTTAGAWTNSGRTFNPANDLSFASGEAVNTVNISGDLFESGNNDLLSAGALKSYFGILPATWEFTYTENDINNAYIYLTAPHVWHNGEDRWFSVMVPLRGHGTITVTKNPNGSCRYAFLRSNSLVINSLPDFCSGTDLIQVTSTDPITYDIPEDCRYFYAYVISTTNGTAVNVAPTVSVELFSDNSSQEQTQTVDPGFIKVRYAHWNMGHFSLGNGSDTTTTYLQYPTQHAKWVQHINAINADVFGCCEYNTNFVNASGNDPAIIARDDLFSPYAYAYVGTKTGYNLQALFSNKKFSQTQSVVYNLVYQTGRYYLAGTIQLGSHTVKFVETHLDLNQGTHTDGSIRLAQIQLLINDFANDDYVVFSGDFNVADPDEYDTFINAGYVMANHGYLGDIITLPEKSACADNIICKGFTINNIQTVLDTDIVDHYCIYADLTLIE